MGDAYAAPESPPNRLIMFPCVSNQRQAFAVLRASISQRIPGITNGAPDAVALPTERVITSALPVRKHSERKVFCLNRPIVVKMLINFAR